MATDKTTNKKIDFQSFCRLVNADFDSDGGEWMITEKGFMARFYSRSKTTDKRRALRDAFDFLNLIERFRAPLYMSGSTPLNNESLDFDLGSEARLSIIIHINNLTQKYFYGLHWSDANGAGGTDPFSAAREKHFDSRELAIRTAFAEAGAIFAGGNAQIWASLEAARNSSLGTDAALGFATVPTLRGELSFMGRPGLLPFF